MGGRGTSVGHKLWGADEVHFPSAVPDLPARMNKMYNGNNMSISNTVSTFESKHANSGTEHLIAYDDNGFVSTYTHGGKSAVGFTKDQVAGKHVIHNHPSGGHFSKVDLQNLSTTGMKSITATSATGVRYTAEKTNKFDAKGWSKALNEATTKLKVDNVEKYNQALHDWLTENAPKYGVKYTREKWGK